MDKRPRIRSWLRLVVTVACAWVFVFGILVLEFAPNLPRTGLQWMLLIGFGPPFYFLFEWWWERLFSSERGYAISKRSFSILRVAILFAAMTGLFSVCGFIAWFLTK